MTFGPFSVRRPFLVGMIPTIKLNVSLSLCVYISLCLCLSVFLFLCLSVSICCLFCSIKHKNLPFPSLRSKSRMIFLSPRFLNARQMMIATRTMTTRQNMMMSSLPAVDTCKERRKKLKILGQPVTVKSAYCNHCQGYQSEELEEKNKAFESTSYVENPGEGVAQIFAKIPGG